ncbi:phosphoribosylanthranilate isomerase [Pararhodobacter zhoushanensis]|uniref:N-(5'-phosphoribosyl)anthranilate isomerase n=1 Tax=Pararhodobacter zhoushanensis TaxID=2479545 RepID=A0ABT3H2L7_9RHOB|nr:phosphoribosylanthranilate isomerase [Pararhodobacter zhoushanensis]MCW1934029.1 phosphoribosylanthranilate isomerase [Pararhodobacter zhoushanensis]
MSAIRVKICGLTRPQDIDAVVAAQAAYGGLVFFPKSPRAVSIAQARDLSLASPVGLARVGLFVNPDDALLDAVLAEVPLDILQLHGTESPERVAELRARHGLPVMKAVGVAGPEDLDALTTYGSVADMLLVDAKPPRDAVLPGGNGLAFDWRLIAGRRWPVPWMLAGGLTPDNVREAILLTGATQVDVSSGVESAPGVKDADAIARFTAAAKG